MDSICLSDCFNFLAFCGLLWNTKHALVQFTCAPSLSNAITVAKTLISGLGKAVVIQKRKAGEGVNPEETIARNLIRVLRTSTEFEERHNLISVLV